MYAESPEARSQSRARFHKTFDKMHAKFKAQLPDRECRYHIIAHSLGTVLTLDAMLTAHVSKKVQEAHDSEKQRFLVEATGTALPLDQPGETGKLARLGQAIGLDEAQKTTDGSKKFPWVLQVKTLFTLGSPIDKFLVVWDRNVRELTEGLDQSQLFHRDGERIQHFNFCDEQDPFGHRLNVMYETEGRAPSPIAPIAQRIFQRRDDFVFSRYPQPIVAHTKYLSDTELVRWIRDEARTGSADPIKSEFLFDGGRFMQALGWNYFWIQTLTMSLLVFSLTAMSTAADWKTRLILAIPTAWSFWMILPEFLWLIAAWRVLVAGIRKPEEQRDRIWRQRFAMISSLFVDGLFVLSFPLVVALAIDSGQTGPGNGLWIVIGTVVAFLLILWKVVGLVARRTSPLQRKSVLSRILWFGMTLGLTLLVGFWKELPMFEGNAIDQWITSSVSGLLKLLPRSTGTLITHPRAYEFLIPISGAIAIAGTFDILIRAAATKYLRFKRVE